MAWKTSARQKFRTAKTVSAFMPDIAKAAFRAHGFPSAALLTEWAAIAGADLASFTRPEKILWPRRRETEPEDDFEGPRTQRRGATLVLRADGPRALEVQFMAAQVLDRLNRYFGYGAITELRIVQAPIARARSRSAPGPAAPPPDPVAVDGIGNTQLQQALGRLGAQVKAG